MFRIAAATAAVLLAGTVASHAQGLTAVRPLPGYSCMRLGLSAEQMRDPNKLPVVHSGPSRESGALGVASAVVIVRSPMNVQGGMAEMLFLDGRTGWIDAQLLRPYATPAAPNAHCTPSIMSNGRPGFAG